MRIIEKPFAINTTYPLEQLGDPEKLMFLDIETTGLSARNSEVYLIGTVTMREDHFVLTQYFAEEMADEAAVLIAFSEAVHPDTILIHYNGSTFDVPYLEACFKEYHIPSPLTGLTEIDLLKTARKLAPILGLTNCKLKTVQEFLGIHREDPYTGGELIEQYLAFRRTQDPGLFRNLILHNEEDLTDLPPVLDLLYYRDLPLSIPTFANVTAAGDTLTVTGSLSCTLPAPIHLSKNSLAVEIEGSRITATSGCVCGRMNHYFEDYKNYYYLPADDMAVHSHIAEFMDKKSRRKARPEEAYAAKEGTFFPQIKEAITPSFREDYRSADLYFEYREDIPEARWSAYLADCLSLLTPQRRRK